MGLSPRRGPLASPRGGPQGLVEGTEMQSGPVQVVVTQFGSQSWPILLGPCWDSSSLLFPPEAICCSPGR